MQTHEDATAATTVPPVIGVTSHRNVSAHEVEPIRRRVRGFFVQLQREFPALPLVVLSTLAEGGDQLVAQEALAIGARLIAPLPLPESSTRWQPSWVSRSRSMATCPTRTTSSTYFCCCSPAVQG